MTRFGSLAWKFALIAAVALALTALPGADHALDMVLTALTIAFLAAIAFLGYRMYSRFQFELDSLPDRNRAVLYGSIGLVLLSLAATSRLFDVGGAGVIVWLALLAASAYGAYWVYARYRAYE
ncbi:MAG: hypothetical protein GXY03_13505 [Solirubrobacterales bacterium]|nr:hypothetical protein [Solirubrobacterales bacterium]